MRTISQVLRVAGIVTLVFLVPDGQKVEAVSQPVATRQPSYCEQWACGCAEHFQGVELTNAACACSDNGSAWRICEY